MVLPLEKGVLGVLQQKIFLHDFFKFIHISTVFFLKKTTYILKVHFKKDCASSLKFGGMLGAV